MIPFSQQQVPPAVKSHLDSQFSFFADVSKRMFDGMQRVNELNVKIAQSVIEDTLESSHKLLEANNTSDFVSVAVSQFQPVPDRLRTYQQNLTSIAADVQVDLSRTAEQHVPQTARTAAAAAEELVRRGSEESQKAIDRQKEAIDKMARVQDDIASAVQKNGHIQAQSQQAGKQPVGKTI